MKNLKQIINDIRNVLEHPSKDYSSADRGFCLKKLKDLESQIEAIKTGIKRVECQQSQL